MYTLPWYQWAVSNKRLLSLLMLYTYCPQGLITMTMSSNRNVFRNTGPSLSVRDPPITGGFPSQGPVTRSFDVFFHLRLNKRLHKQSRRRWFGNNTYSNINVCAIKKTLFHPSISQVRGDLKYGGIFSEDLLGCLNNKSEFIRLCLTLSDRLWYHMYVETNMVETNMVW